MTAENRQWLELFRQTHRLRVDGLSGSVRYERIALPRAGGVYDQPAQEMEALEVLEATATAVLHEQMAERRKRAKREGASASRRRGR